MADKEINPKDPQATEVADEEVRDEAERKSQAARGRLRVSGRKTSAIRGK